MKRVLAALAVTTMLFVAPVAPAIAGRGGGGGNNSVKCNGPGDDTCGNTIVGDTDGDGKVRYECHNKSGGVIVVNAANCTNIFFPILVIVDL